MAVGLLLVTVTAAAGCDSVQARERRDVLQQSAFSHGLAESKVATASADGTSSLEPVPAHAAQPVFDPAPYLRKPLTSVVTDKREVALTFDDGPSANTGKVLAILKDHGAHATFFVVGRRAKNDDHAIVSAIGQGHEVASHTWSHTSLRHLDATLSAGQIDRTQALLKAETGSAPLFVRPRGGKYDETGRAALADRGLIMALWSIRANDVVNSPPPAVLVANATSSAEPGSIILMHETNANTVVALPRILEELRAKGLRAVTLSQLLADGHP